MNATEVIRQLSGVAKDIVLVYKARGEEPTISPDFLLTLFANTDFVCDVMDVYESKEAPADKWARVELLLRVLNEEAKAQL